MTSRCTFALAAARSRIYQQTFIDTYSKVGFAKLYDRKTPLTAADLLNDRVVPFFEEHGIPLSRVLTDRGTEYCGQPDRHEYELYLAVENIDHTRTKTKHPQTNGICERFNQTVLNEFYRVAFRKKLYHSLEELQADLDAWLRAYNEERTHQGRWCYGKTPLQHASSRALPAVSTSKEVTSTRTTTSSGVARYHGYGTMRASSRPERSRPSARPKSVGSGSAHRSRSA
jgi:hypothetical protein